MIVLSHTMLKPHVTIWCCQINPCVTPNSLHKGIWDGYYQLSLYQWLIGSTIVPLPVTWSPDLDADPKKLNPYLNPASIYLDLHITARKVPFDNNEIELKVTTAHL